MDRRQRRTRELIFKAFTELLAQKNAGKITVGEIIEKADIGRATFYAHFPTKDLLIKELSEELFCHVFDSTKQHVDKHRHIFDCEAPSSVCLHLFEHLQNNDNGILNLLASPNNDMFLRYFKNGLIKLIENGPQSFGGDSPSALPKDFLVNHLASTFVETVRWWIKNNRKQTPEEITRYYLLAINAGNE